MADLSDSNVLLLNRPYNKSDIDKFLFEHKEILKHSKRIGVYWIICAGLYWFFYSSRWYLWISFAREIGYYNETNIAIEQISSVP